MINSIQSKVAENNQIMTMIDSLPINIIVINSNLKLLGINRAAQTFLKIQNTDNYFGIRQTFITDHEYVKNIIEEVKSKTIVSNKKMIIRKLDKTVALVDVFAHFYNNYNYNYYSNDIILFMFF